MVNSKNHSIWYYSNTSIIWGLYTFQAQFFIVTVHNSQLLFIECAYPWKYVAFIQGFTTIVAVLFLNFYIKTYRQQRESASKSRSMKSNGITNGYHANDHMVANGKYHETKTNGYVCNLQERKNVNVKLWQLWLQYHNPHIVIYNTCISMYLSNFGLSHYLFSDIPFAK